MNLRIHDARVTASHVYFWNSVFSNFHLGTFTHQGHIFASSEQAFMWRKAVYFKDQLSADILLKETIPARAKAQGRAVRGFDKALWDRDCVSIMEEVLYDKFSQDAKLKSVILATECRTLVEGSPKDFLWGVGLHWQSETINNERNWLGQNLLGKALMSVRSKIKNT